MDKSGYRTIPQALNEYITFLVQALPIRSVPTFIELLIGAMLTQAGFVTQAWLAVDMHRHWTSYYKWLQKGRWSWIALGRQMVRMILTFFPQSTLFFVIDDTLIFRASKKAPGSRFHHQHGSKANRPAFVRGQCWVSLAAVVSNGLNTAAIPILARLMRSEGNSSKLKAAKTLIRTVSSLLKLQKVCFLLDSWYMRKTLLSYITARGFNLIGQVRIDTALYDIPCQTGKRGRPRKYGEKYTAERIGQLPETRTRMFLYGKKQWVRYRSNLVLARFLKGLKVKVVWLRFEKEDGTLTKIRLILATDLALSASDIIAAYAKRWWIEPMFAQVKNHWGWKDAWQQTRQVLHRWLQILSIGYALPQLLALKECLDVQKLAGLAPWRVKQPITAGRVRLGLQMILGHVRIRHWWNPKSRKFEPPDMAKSPPQTDYGGKTA
ncbi:MAG: transposase [Nitrospirota bacterium]|nr:transposase [Nitrospirota bacterium]